MKLKRDREEKKIEDEMVMNIVDQPGMAKDIKSISEETPLEKTYKGKKHVFTSVLKFMEYHVQELKRWAGIKFEHKTKISEPELKQMAKMKKKKIPFCYYEYQVAIDNLRQSKHPDLEYLIVRSGEEIVAFQAFELKRENDDIEKYIYIA